MSYLLDANVFIEAKRRHYGMDFCPAFWDWLVAQNAAGRVFSIEKVGDELAVGGDELAGWAAARGETFFLRPDEEMLGSLAAVGEWVSARGYRPAAVSAFLQDADYYLVAHAHAHAHVVVTHESPSDGERQVKIPNVCIGMRTKCVTPFDLVLFLNGIPVFTGELKNLLNGQNVEDAMRPVQERPRPPRAAPCSRPLPRALRGRSGPRLRRHPLSRADDAVSALQPGQVRRRWQPARAADAHGLRDGIPLGGDLGPRQRARSGPPVHS